MVKTVLKREELYNAVWTTPMSRLAPQYDLSDVGLAKICKAMDILIPYRGYWAKKDYGKETTIAPLPEVSSDTLTEYEINSVQTSNDLVIPTSKLDELKKIYVPKSISKYSPMVEDVRNYIQSHQDDEERQIIETPDRLLEVAVSKKNLNRACRILETIIRELKKLDGDVVIAPHKYNKSAFNTYAVIKGEKVAFTLKEKLKRVPHKITEEDRNRKREISWFSPPEFDLVPSNMFTLEIETWTSKRSMQRRWMDKENKSLDEQIGFFIIGMLKLVPYVREERLENEEKLRQYELKKVQGSPIFLIHHFS